MIKKYLDNDPLEYTYLKKSIPEVILLYIKRTRIEGLETLFLWLSCAEQEDNNILQLIDQCKIKMKVIIFLSGNQYTVKETIDTLLANHRKNVLPAES